jgi:hypothetical protein
MAPKKKCLGTYVRERRQKYRHPYRFLFHVSTAPRKVLVPHRTTYQERGDDERQQPLLFLCPLRDVRQWIGWYMGKFPRSRGKDVGQAWSGEGHIALYVHIVRVDPLKLEIPRNRYYQEFTTRDALRPVAIVPIRFKSGKPLNLARVASKMDQIKDTAIRPVRSNDGEY